MTKPSPYTGRVNALSDDEFELLCDAVRERRCRDDIGIGTLAEAAAEYRSSPACPVCGSGARKDGRAPSGVQRFKCLGCGHRFTALAGTVFENCKKDLPTWVDFVRR